MTDAGGVSPAATLPAERVERQEAAGTIEIALPGGVRVMVRGRFEERALRAVLGALRSA